MEAFTYSDSLRDFIRRWDHSQSENQSSMTDELSKLVAEARGHHMTDEERAAQRVSFAYGNLAIDKPETSRELVQQMSDEHKPTMDRIADNMEKAAMAAARAAEASRQMTKHSIYYHLSKYALWVSSLVLVGAMIGCIVTCGLTGDKTLIPPMISSAQGLSCIALGVMSYHLGLKSK